jgi:U3 small nucleolar RNA-associated protein 13
MPDKSLLALATNSEELRIVSITEGSSSTYFGADVAQLKGHEDIIICLAIDWSGHWIATGAKDNIARLWRIDASTNSFTCYATFTGHAESIGAITLPTLIPSITTPHYTTPLEHPPMYIITGSQDQTIKRWLVPTPGKPPRAQYTRKAHDKDINALDISPTGLFASASQDKTVKIWSVDEGEVQGVLRGHKRGVWSVKFAPSSTPSIAGSSKGLVLTGSGDKTLKIWNLADYSCVRTFEGHSNSVLKVLWLVLPGMMEGDTRKHVQVASAAGDGLVKVWDATTGELETTLDNHTDRVWALALNPATNMLVSGSSDSTVSFWKDTTSATHAATTEEANQFIEQEQELQNYIRTGSYRKAITLALQLNHPARLLSLFSAVAIEDEAGSLCGSKAVDEVLRTLSDEQVYMLLLRLRDWNTNNRTAGVAQRILWTIVKSYPATKLCNLHVKVEKGKSLKEILDGLKVYTERHYKRSEELVDDSYLIEYTLQEMEGLIDSGVEMDVD